jgi:hypothetical protein
VADKPFFMLLLAELANVHPTNNQHSMSTSAVVIAQAIAEKKVIEFLYRGGVRTVEPQMLATNEAGHFALSAWFLRGHSSSGDGPGWREYLVSQLGPVTVLGESFAGARPGLKRSGGEKFHRVVAVVS